MTRAEQTEALWQWILNIWIGGEFADDVDGLDLIDKAADLGLLRVEEYDPAKHGESDAEPGDLWYVPVEP